MIKITGVLKWMDCCKDKAPFEHDLPSRYQVIARGLWLGMGYVHILSTFDSCKTLIQWISE